MHSGRNHSVSLRASSTSQAAVIAGSLFVNIENAGTTENNLRHRIYWKDIQATKGVHLEFDGIPFLIFVIVNRTKAQGH